MIGKRFMSALTPAERERAANLTAEFVHRGYSFFVGSFIENCAQTGNTRLTKTRRMYLPLLGGEGRGEGECSYSLAKFALGFALLISFLIPPAIRAADSNELVSNWLLAQTNIHTWSAGFTQTRSLKSLTQPLISTGRVWFASPNRFRWELGQPAQTIALRQPAQMLVIYPKLKRVEKFPLGADAGPWKDALALLEAGFARDRAELESRFSIRSIQLTDGVCEIAMQPKSASARKMISQIRIAFGANDFLLRSTELQFADGSTMRNDFRTPKLNEKLDESLFTPNLAPDFKVVEPLKK